MTIVRPEVAQFKTDTEWRKEFEVLVERERTQRGALDVTIFEMGDKLVQWQPDRATLTQLANDFGYKRNTLEQRYVVALNIPPEIRNSDLSYSGHVEALKIDDVAARNELIKASSGRSANLVRVAVYEKRLELGEIRKSNKPRAETLQLAGKLNWSCGAAMSDGETVVKIRGTIVDGQVQFTIDSTNPFGDHEVSSATQGKKLILDGTVVEVE